MRSSASALARALPLLMLASCGDQQLWILRPRGPITGASLNSIVIDFLAMMVIIGPTTLLLCWCIWRYRRNARARYAPGWENSLTIEIVSWGFPLAIVAFLSFYSFRGTFAVNPFGPGVMQHGASADADRPPINVDVITTDWQWLFVYPDLRVAAANELVIPEHTPIRFRMTSATVTNDILIPQLMGEIDLMPGMLTRQGLMADTPGDYQGLAADFNGPGFSWMQFSTKVVSSADFAHWVATAQASPNHMDHATYEKFASPTINENGRTTIYSQADPNLLQTVMSETMAGKIWPTPTGMIEKKAAEERHTRRQQLTTPDTKS